MTGYGGERDRRLRRVRQAMVAILATLTASTMALIGTAGATPAQGPTAAAAPISATVETACNNTFSPTKFPLTYNITATPSASPVAADAPFTVDFDVELVASAGFLNGVYDLLGAVEIPITQNKVTIAPMAGATGAPVQAVMAAPFTIPAPSSIPIASGVTVPIGSITGSYTATSGTASFQILGNAWAPTDTLPSGVTEAGWIGSAASVGLTTTGKQTYAQASLANGVIKPYLVCMGGSWTPSGEDYVPPLVPATGFAQIPITGTSTSTTTSSTTTSTTTSTPTGSTTTTSTPTGSTTTTTSVVPTTSTTSTTLPGPSETEVTGTARYAAECTNDVTPDVYPLGFEITGTTATNVRSGDVLTVVDQTWKVGIPGDLLGLAASVAGKDSLDALASTSLSGTNTDPRVGSPAPVAAKVGPIVTDGGVTQPLTVTLRPGDVRFVATGGNAEFRMAETTIAVELSEALTINLTCTPASGSDPFVVAAVSGPPVPTTTTPGPTGTAAPAGSGTGGTGGAGTSTVASGTLARTGADSRMLALQVLAGLLLLQLGYLVWSAVAPLRPARARVR